MRTRADFITYLLRLAFEQLTILESESPLASDAIVTAIVNDLRSRRPASIAPFGELPAPTAPNVDPRTTVKP